jgi:galactokinase
VITENYRVLEALEGIRPERFGELMNAFHASLRDDYEVSVPALDILVGILQRTPGVFGARLTGAGFGRACVTLVTSLPGIEIATKVVEEYKYTGYNGKILVPTINL